MKERQAKCKTLKKKKGKGQEDQAKLRDDQAKCLAESNEEFRAAIETLKSELEALKAGQGVKKDERLRIKEMKERLETLRKDLLQEVMLVERCKNIKLI